MFINEANTSREASAAVESWFLYYCDGAGVAVAAGVGDGWGWPPGHP